MEAELFHESGLDRVKTKDMYDFLMFEIQKQMVAIDDLKQNNTSTAKDAADLAILSQLLAFSEGVDDKLMKERMEQMKQTMHTFFQPQKK
ncbi:hypothetical protein HYW21_05410 [Candidatus Woesearchaeota archaeon]|nr:hypothetical protein [Candidatus Woesearchaeota archaeon]